jgi:hypothetical protein
MTTRYTLHATRYTPPPTPYTLHPNPYAPTLNPTPYTPPSTLHLLHPATYTLYHTPYTLGLGLGREGRRDGGREGGREVGRQAGKQGQGLNEKATLCGLARRGAPYLLFGSVELALEFLGVFARVRHHLLERGHLGRRLLQR